MDEPTSFELLGLPDSATSKQVKARWRELAGKLHPDRGGNADEFDRMNKAYKEALAEAELPLTCQNCNGTGRVKIIQGFAMLTMNCAECGGSGAIARGGEQT